MWVKHLYQPDDRAWFCRVTVQHFSIFTKTFGKKILKSQAVMEARQSWKLKTNQLQQRKHVVISSSGNHNAQHDKNIVCYRIIHLFHLHAYIMICKYTHATALSLCQILIEAKRSVNAEQSHHPPSWMAFHYWMSPWSQPWKIHLGGTGVTWSNILTLKSTSLREQVRWKVKDLDFIKGPASSLVSAWKLCNLAD